MTDIVKRLNTIKATPHFFRFWEISEVATHAAAEITNLRSERDAAKALCDEMAKALEPFAEVGEHILAEAPQEATMINIMRDCEGSLVQMSLGYWRTAIAAFRKAQEVGNG